MQNILRLKSFLLNNTSMVQYLVMCQNPIQILFYSHVSVYNDNKGKWRFAIYLFSSMCTLFHYNFLGCIYIIWDSHIVSYLNTNQA